MRKIFLAIFLAFSVFLVAMVPKPVEYVPRQLVLKEYRAKNVDMVNMERIKEGLPALRENVLLDTSAQLKAEDMIKEGYWSHISPKGVEPWYFFKEAGYYYHYAGENLGRNYGYATPESFIDLWMKSEGHKENILSTKYEEIGVGISTGEVNGVKTMIVVNHFGAE